MLRKKSNPQQNNMPTPAFDDIKVSTTTVIVNTNLNVQLQWLFDICPVYNSFPKKTSAKALKQYIMQLDPPYGTVVRVRYMGQHKGSVSNKKHFRNSLDMVMYVSKLVTIKIPQQGKFQLTGCIHQEHVTSCIRYLWAMLCCHPSHASSYTLLHTPETFTTIIDTVMTNKVFKLGFRVNRQNLDRYVNRHTPYNSLLETSFGYTGVNIKIPFSVDRNDLIFTKFEYHLTRQQWIKQTITYNEYVSLVPSRHQTKKYRNTFLVFHSGTAIMSGMTLYYMRDGFNEFMQIIDDAREQIEENIK